MLRLFRLSILTLLLTLVACSPGKQVRLFYTCPPASSTREGGLCVVNIDGSDPSVWLSVGTVYGAPGFTYDISPDGTQVVYSPFQQDDYRGFNNNGLYITSLLERKPSRLIGSGNGYYASPVFSPDGRQIVFLYADPSGESIFLSQINPDGSGFTNLVQLPEPGGDLPFLSPNAWSPDGSKIILSYEDDKSLIYDLRSGTFTEIAGIEYFSSLSWSPDGQMLAYASLSGGMDGGLHVANANGTNARRLSSAEDGCYGIDWSPDGRRIACASGLGGDILLYDLSGGMQRVTSNLAEFTIYPRWSPDGSRIAYFSGKQNSSSLSSLAIEVLDVNTLEMGRLVTLPTLDRDSYFLFSANITWQGETVPGGLSSAGQTLLAAVVALLAAAGATFAILKVIKLPAIQVKLNAPRVTLPSAQPVVVQPPAAQPVALEPPSVQPPVVPPLVYVQPAPAARTKRCRNCGQPVDETARKCPACGSPLTGAPASVTPVRPSQPQPPAPAPVPARSSIRFCANCREPLPETVKYCLVCGAPATRLPTEVVSPPQPMAAPTQPKTSPVCARCGTPIPAGVRFCTACGAERSVDSPPVAETLGGETCPLCGGDFVLRNGVRYCLSCQTAFKPQPDAPPPPPPPAPGKPSPAEIRQMLQRGAELVRLGEYAAARELLQDAVDADPTLANTWLWLGWAIARQGQMPAARYCFTRARALGDPNAEQALSWLAAREKRN